MKISEIYRFLNESSKNIDEDEMTSAILSTSPQGDSLKCGDNYASGDMRMPKIIGKIQKRRNVQEDAEETSYVYRYMSINELSNILADNAFGELVSFEDDSEGLRDNPAGDFPYFKSFSFKISKGGLKDYMGDDSSDIHLICLFSLENLKKTAKKTGTKLIKYKYDKGFGAIEEYEYRLFSKTNKIPINPKALIRKIIFTKQSGDVQPEDIENVLLDLSYANINVPVEFIANPLSAKSKKISYKLDENDEIVVIK